MGATRGRAGIKPRSHGDLHAAEPDLEVMESSLRFAKELTGQLFRLRLLYGFNFNPQIHDHEVRSKRTRGVQGRADSQHAEWRLIYRRERFSQWAASKNGSFQASIGIAEGAAEFFRNPAALIEFLCLTKIQNLIQIKVNRHCSAWLAASSTSLRLPPSKI